MLPPRFAIIGFRLAGLANICGVLLFSLGLTNSYLSEVYPTVMSQFGLACIIMWGFAYIAVARHYSELKWLVLLFAIEKAAYVLSWWQLIRREDFSLEAVYAQSPLTGIFYSIYGTNDLVFGLFFLYIFATLHRKKAA